MNVEFFYSSVADSVCLNTLVASGPWGMFVMLKNQWKLQLLKLLVVYIFNLLQGTAAV